MLQYVDQSTGDLVRCKVDPVRNEVVILGSGDTVPSGSEEYAQQAAATEFNEELMEVTDHLQFSAL